MSVFNLFKKQSVGEVLKYEPIIVVSGLPRSGTSMMMKVLEAGGFPIVTDNLRAADDDNPKGYYELEEVKALGENQDPEWLLTSSGKVVKIISFLLQFLPTSHTYKVIFMRRAIDEILASQHKMLERRGETSADSDEKVAETFTEHLKRVKVWLANQKNMEILYVDHRTLISDPKSVIDQLVGFLGKPLSPETLADMVKVPDQKLYRNRSK